MELRCSRDLALRLGAVDPIGIEHHRAMKNAGDLLVRDVETSRPMFWAWVDSVTRLIAAKSS